jgi:hypothetical protein
MTLIRDSLSRLENDPWRGEVGFSPDLEDANHELFAARDDNERERIVSVWLERYQPCLFGRIAATKDSLSFCFLTEADLQLTEPEISTKIQNARLHWKRDAVRGLKTGFLICVVSPTVTAAVPSQAMRTIAQRLASLYLLTEVAMDEIYLDAVRLEQPTDRRPTWEWSVGVNYFCAQGDQRWWHDHRFPGGMAFSMNSVGHMVKEDMLSHALSGLARSMATETEGGPETRIDSLERALVVAMLTIANAHDTVSGRATELLKKDGADSVEPSCPATLPAHLQSYDHRTYLGHYHTDVTLPSVYFRSDVERPPGTEAHRLDFTYLYDDTLDNFAFRTMGAGIRVRLAGDLTASPAILTRIATKRSKAHGLTCPADPEDRSLTPA